VTADEQQNVQPQNQQQSQVQNQPQGQVQGQAQQQLPRLSQMHDDSIKGTTVRESEGADHDPHQVHLEG